MKNQKIIIWLLAIIFLAVGREGLAGSKNKISSEKMVFISGGIYIPLYKTTNSKGYKKVHSFYMDKYAVTNEQYLKFVKANPEWRKSKVKRIFADETYLMNWKNDLELGEKINPQSPVTYVSWFAAKAYSKWAGKRLPTVAEWEYVAAASKTKKYDPDDPKMLAAVLNWYAEQTPENLPKVGSTDKNFWGIYDIQGLVWEWTYDFNSALITGDSRSNSAVEQNTFCGGGSASAGDVKNYTAFMRIGFRSSLKANYCVHNLGFRCVKDEE